MAQLDRFLNLLITNNGTALVLSEGDVATVTIKDSPRPVMKQPLTSAQILTLVREIAPPNQPHSLDAAGGVSFEYSSADGTFEVALNRSGSSARHSPDAISASCRASRRCSTRGGADRSGTACLCHQQPCARPD